MSSAPCYTPNVSVWQMMAMIRAMGGESRMAAYIEKLQGPEQVELREAFEGACEYRARADRQVIPLTAKVVRLADYRNDQELGR